MGNRHPRLSTSQSLSTSRSIANLQAQSTSKSIFKSNSLSDILDVPDPMEEKREPYKTDWVSLRSPIEIDSWEDADELGNISCIGFKCSQITEQLVLGNGEMALNIGLLRQAKITHIVNLADGILNVHEGKFNYLKKDVYDGPTCKIKDHFEEILLFMRRAIMSGGVVLVHCNMGISRSATVIIAYMMTYGRMNYAEAFTFVKSRRPQINPNPGFVAQLKEYEATLNP